MGPVAWFSDEDIRRLAGQKSYERGLGYADAVGDVDELPNGVVATVHGTEPYGVRLLDGGGKLRGECSCPFGQDGAFCKHCVAVARALLADAPTEPTPRRRATRRRKPDLRAHLASMDRANLVDLLLELAAEDPALHRRLSLLAATSGDVDVTELRRLVNGLRGRGFLDYSGSFRYARKTGDVLDALDRVATDHPGMAGPLYRLVITHVTRTSEQADDSAGAIGDAAGRAVEGYAAACRAAPPDPVELAIWLIEFQLDGPGWPELPIEEFAEALGEDGLTAYRQRLADLNAAMPPGSASRFDHRRFMVTHLRERYLRAVAGDVDALIALYAEDLSHPYQYVRIGEALRDAGRFDDAISWLRRGLAESDRSDARLDALLAELYTRTGQHAEALDIHWSIFRGRPDVATHRQLLDAAERAGSLAEAGERAMSHLRERAARGGYHADPLVSILLSTDDIDAAWAAANQYGCSTGCLFNIAERRAATHPADAIPVYAQQVELAIDRKKQSGYAEAAKLLGVLRSLHKRAGSDFAGYLAEIKETHRRKRTLLTELTRARL